ncbi:MAG: PD40 domain-containing protein [Chloroflexi bacterium]|nr:PD40 domain-containing protein [Chloroflexota bacterium]
MSMPSHASRAVRTLTALGAMVALVGLPATAAEPSATPTSGADVRHILIEDTRIVSMSPDGSAIVALRPAVGFRRGELCVFETDTLRQRSCADLSGLGAGIRLASIIWSPDGAHIAFVEEAFQLFIDGDLWLMDTATGTLTNLDDDGFEGRMGIGEQAPTEPITLPAAPVFTPDGSAVVYSRSYWSADLRANDLAVVPVTGGPAERIVLVDAQAPGVVFEGIVVSPDGATVYFSRSAPGPGDRANGIWSVRLDGSWLRQVAGATDPGLGEPYVQSVSADGTTLLAWYPRAVRSSLDGDVLALIDVGSGSVTSLGSDEPAPATVQMAALSPTDDRVLLVTRRTTPDHQVWLLDPASGSREPVVPDGLFEAGPPDWSIIPTWATDGRVLVPGGAALSEASLLTIGE